MSLSQTTLLKSPVSIFIFLTLVLCASHTTEAQFANGADIGWLSQMEAEGYTFKNSSGVQENCLDILKEKGINALRFRVWVNPTSIYCSRRDVARMAHRADSAGFNVMIDFHCSDWWADPSHQTKPAAWANDSFPQLLTDLYNHVHSVLDTLKSLGVTPKWVQIGNETNDGFLWEDGRASTHMANFARLIDTGYSAVKAIDTSIQVIVHLSDGHKDSMYRWMFDGLRNNGVRWDIIGMSVYPFWAGLSWAVDDSLALITMNDLIARYNTRVMVVEAGYLYNQPIAANQYLLDLIAKTKAAGGLGVFYWEPECYNWQSYNLGAWDPTTKQPTVAMDAFLGISALSVANENPVRGFALDVYPNPFNPQTTVQFTVERNSRVTLNVYDMLGREVRTLLDETKNPGSYKIVWDGRDSNGISVSSGTYFVRMETGSNAQVRKIVLQK